ncbi:hypothetical protein Cgig2_026006 [Carnegiea gigantea]|uniref:Reverse transcriptase n=1 Tax=Carnegiea gigantea TaxID=171969 RepID=A0A9Q1QAS6_9CARY|nr:hypothetical protein Cgig2_026006 [Carnegiea gigantea]
MVLLQYRKMPNHFGSKQLGPHTISLTKTSAKLHSYGFKNPELTPFGMVFGIRVPTLHRQVTKATYQQVIKKVEKRLTGWKTKCLSLTERATLIQSIVTMILAYTMQTVKFPRAVCNELDRKVRRFLWGVRHKNLDWRMTNEKDSLWARVLRQKYCNGSRDLERVQGRPNALSTWRGIWEN